MGRRFECVSESIPRAFLKSALTQVAVAASYSARNFSCETLFVRQLVYSIEHSNHSVAASQLELPCSLNTEGISTPSGLSS
jgi:hypothetical protein